MKQHDWKIEEVSVHGPKFFWVCRTCGAGGGPSFLPWEKLDVKAPIVNPFLVGTPLVDLPADCDESKKRIDDFIERYPVWKEYADRARTVPAHKPKEPA